MFLTLQAGGEAGHQAIARGREGPRPEKGSTPDPKLEAPAAKQEERKQTQEAVQRGRCQ